MAAAEIHMRRRRRTRRLDRLIFHAILLAGMLAVVAAVQLLVLLVLGRLPTDEERTVLIVSMLAAIIAAFVYQPARTRLERLASGLLPAEREAPGAVLRALGTRLSRAVPLEELLLELVQSLRRDLVLEVAEIWTGSNGLYERAMSDPDSGWASLALATAEESVLARSAVSGPARLAVWLPALLEGRGEGPLRVAPLVNTGELLGLILVKRPPEGEPFSEEDERVLAELARQVGLALRNIRLDTQLRASLEQVKRQSEQLRESRARVVSAADAERRRIERDLHDGAQQQLVALAVNLRLARELAGSDPQQATDVLRQLADDVEATLEELREFAHGIYPPLLADRGLGEALSAVARRAPIPTRLEAATIGRHAPDVEATVYFCCLEALQNAGKHAGRNATATLRVTEQEEALVFEVSDDGAGFDPADAASGAGFENMTDRLGAIGGTLRVESSPGRGAHITGTIPILA